MWINAIWEMKPDLDTLGKEVRDLQNGEVEKFDKDFV